VNPIKINALLGEVPEGISFDKRSMRLTVLFGIAAATVIQLPGTPVENDAVRGYFFENAAGVRDQYFQINEAVTFNVDRALEIGYVLFAERYNMAYRPQQGWFIDSTNPFKAALDKVAPESIDLNLTGNGDLSKVVDFLRECLATD
jgi:hypothetical protein